MSSAWLEDASGVRALSTRWLITGDLVTVSSCRFGGEPSTSIDMPILRVPFGTTPLLPGSTVAGALRSHLTDRLVGYQSDEPSDVERLFGEAKYTTVSSNLGQSPLIVFDSRGVLAHGTEIRDGVAINSESGIAEDHNKFDMEIVPAGTHFPLRFELVLSRTDNEQELLELFIAALEAFDHGELSLGCRRNRGLGLVKAREWRVHRYDLTTQGGWLEWLASDPALTGMTGQTRPTIKEAFSDSQIVPRHATDDHRRRTIFEVDVVLKSTLLIRSGGTHADDPDVIQLTSAGKTLLSGTSVTGALRARAERIAGLLIPQQAHDLVQSLFGPSSKSRTPTASHLRVSEQFLSDDSDIKAERIRTSRIRIDRFTQGVASGALFEEEMQYGGSFTIRLELRGNSRQERGLLLLALKDLMDGQLPLGGGAAIGRGLVRGTSMRICCLPNGDQYTLSNVGGPADAVSWCDEMIGSLSSTGAPGKGD